MNPIRRNLAVLCGTVLFTLTGIFLWYKILAVFLRDRFGTDDADVALAFAVLTLAHRAPQVAGGWLADRFSRRWIVAGLTLVMAPLYWAASFARTREELTLWLGLCWLVSGLQWPSLVVLQSESSAAGSRGRAFGALDFFILIGMTAGPLLGALAWRTFGADVRDFLRATAAIYVAVAVARALWLREPPREPRIQTKGPAPRGAWVLPLLVVTCGWTAYCLVWDGPFAALYLRQVYEMREDWVNLHAFLCSLLACGGALGAGWLLDRIGTVRTLVVIFAAWIASLAPLLVPGVAGAVGEKFPFGPGFVLLAVAILPAEAFVVAYFHWITALGSGARRGWMVGAFGTAMGVWSAAALAAAGWGYERWGIAAPAGASVAALAAGTILCAARRRAT